MWVSFFLLFELPLCLTVFFPFRWVYYVVLFPTCMWHIEFCKYPCIFRWMEIWSKRGKVFLLSDIIIIHECISVRFLWIILILYSLEFDCELLLLTMNLAVLILSIIDNIIVLLTGVVYFLKNMDKMVLLIINVQLIVILMLLIFLYIQSYCCLL